MRIITAFLFILSLLHANVTNINKNIIKTSHQIKKTKKKYRSIYSKMRQNATDIYTQTKLILKQQQQLKKLSSALISKDTVYKQSKAQLTKLQLSQKALQLHHEQIEEKLVFFIARIMSLYTSINTKNQPTANSMISRAVIKQIIIITGREIKKLNRDFLKNTIRMKMIQTKVATLQNDIKQIDLEKHQLIKIKHQNELSLHHLKLDKTRYKLALERILKQQHLLQSTLSHLKIIKINKIRQKRQQARQKAALKVSINTKLLNVKKVDSSYMRVKTIRYTGAKTIAPLSHFTVIKHYGPYIDPIYKIKIFNESVSLKSRHKNAKVRTILNGKIIFSKKTALLKRVIIMQNAGGIHTIYANLTNLAPGIKVGSRLRRGSVLGRINRQLVFEVTKRNYHINPLELF